MLDDRYGNALTTSSPTARDAYVEGVDHILAATYGATQAFTRALARSRRMSPTPRATLWRRKPAPTCSG